MLKKKRRRQKGVFPLLGQKDKKPASVRGFVTFKTTFLKQNVTLENKKKKKEKKTYLRPLFGKRVIIIQGKNAAVTCMERKTRGLKKHGIKTKFNPSNEHCKAPTRKLLCGTLNKKKMRQ